MATTKPLVNLLIGHVGCERDDRYVDCKRCGAIRAIIRRYSEQNTDLEEIYSNA